MLIKVFGHWINPNLVRYIDSHTFMGDRYSEIVFDKEHKINLGRRQEEEIAEEINRLVKEQNND